MTQSIEGLRTIEQTAKAENVERTMVMSSSTATKTPTKKPVKAKAGKVGTKKPAKKPTKKPTKKPSKAKSAKKAKPTTGQSAEKSDIAFEELNVKELELLGVLNGEGSGVCPKMSIKDLAKAAFLRNKVPAKKPAKAKTASNGKIRANSLEQANYWVRNCLRRLVSEPAAPTDYLVKVSRGVYKISTKGRKRVNAGE